CNSSMAIGAIKYSWDQGKDLEVIATESRPKKQGYITIEELSEYGIPVTLIVDSAVRHKMRDVDKVYVGADTVASNGAVINKIGTSQVALCAHESRVPLTVCAETYKFSSKTAVGDLVEIEERDPSEIVDPSDFPDVTISNPVFDATPSKYVDSIITEEGVISPEGAYRIIKEMEK
ncbi:MAG: S-methyl-5-thioribose-1-phosphate isomerase, partial [Candidatus Thermoplasmatota archaeon]